AGSARHCRRRWLPYQGKDQRCRRVGRSYAQYLGKSRRYPIYTDYECIGNRQRKSKVSHPVERVKMSSNKSTLDSILLAYLVVYIVWGSTFFFIEKALRSFPPFVLGSIRFVIAGTLLMGYCALKGYHLFSRRDIRQAIFIGFLLLFVDMASIIWAEQYISSGIVSILSAATAIWFILFDKPKWKENFSSAPIVLGLLLGFSGVVLLFAEQVFGHEHNNGNRQSLIAMGVMILGTIGWTVGSLFSKYMQEKNKTTVKNQEKSLNVIVKTA